MEPLGGLLGRLEGLLGASWERFGPSWGRLVVVLGRLGGDLDRLGAFCGRLGASWRRLGPKMGTGYVADGVAWRNARGSLGEEFDLVRLNTPYSRGKPRGRRIRRSAHSASPPCEMVVADGFDCFTRLDGYFLSLLA